MIRALAIMVGIAALSPVSVHAQISDGVVKIGVLNDMSGIYSDINGEGGLIATRLAVDDFGGMVLGKKIEVISGDLLNKMASNIAQRWSDIEHVDMIIGGSGSATGLVISRIAADKKKIFIATDTGTADLTGKACNAYTIHWVYDTFAVASGTGSAVVRAGGKTWYFLTADYAFGHALERDTSAVVAANGGNVLGSVRHPLNTSDFASYLLQAQASHAQIRGLANAGGDTIGAIKQAAEFGIVRGGQKLVGLLLFISDVKSIGLELAQGLQLTEAFYWDMNDQTRAFANRWSAMMHGKMPTSVQAGYYSATKHYLEAIQAIGTDQSDKVVARMKDTPTDDALFGKGYIRRDGRKIHNMYLFEVKAPAESKGPYDYYKLIRVIPGEDAFRAVDKGDCSLVTHD
jgi:branched-chain amino acid transport system substrate-binding protein